MQPTDPPLAHAELLQLDNRLWLYTAPTSIANYDLDFRAYFRCGHPWQSPGAVTAVARVGAIAHYDLVYQALHDEQGITLIHTPDQHLRASELPHWYPLIEDLTPRSIWFTRRPTVEEVTSRLTWPIFMKGTRQTSHHQRALAVIESPEQFERVLDEYAADPILRWQGIVCREFVKLQLVDGSDAHPGRLPSAFEFRTFWWKGELAGCGRYWWDASPYRMMPAEERAALAVAGEAARRVAVPFLVVDAAQAEDGRWLVIECNDGQESGYAGITPVALWQRVLDLECLGDAMQQEPDKSAGDASE